MTVSVTEALEREVTGVDEEPSAGDVLAEVEQRQYGDYIACDVDEVRYNSSNSRVEFVVEIPGTDSKPVWGWPVVSEDRETNLHRILNDHGLPPGEVEKMEGRQVLVRPEASGDGSWKMYNPETPGKTVAEEWYDEHPFTPYGDSDDESPDFGFVGLVTACTVTVGWVAMMTGVLPPTVAFAVTGLSLVAGLAIFEATEDDS